MILVVDTNILFSFFWKNSFIKKILTFPKEKFISPEIAFIELKKYSSLIINKTKLSKKEFALEFKKLKSIIKIPLIPLWSNDKKLKEQDKVMVLNTKDVLEIFLD